MRIGVYIVVEDEFADPIYAEPDPEDLEEGLWERACEIVLEAIEGGGEIRGALVESGVLLGWRTLPKAGLSFLAFSPQEIGRARLEAYLKDLSQRYLDEVDDVRRPERAGVADVVVDVIPPWEEEED